MKLRNGKKLTSSPPSPKKQNSNLLSLLKASDLKNYKRPRICTISTFIRSFINFSTNHCAAMYTDKQHDMMWVSCDKLLDDIGKILDVSTGSNGSYADRMTLHQHCDRLSACFNILTNLQSSTSSNLKRIEKKIKSTGFQVRKLDRLLRYLRRVIDFGPRSGFISFHSGNEPGPRTKK